MFDVDPSETYIYFSDYHSYTIFPLHKISASDGSIMTSKQITTMDTEFKTVTVRFYSSGSFLHFTGQTSLLKAVVCVTDISVWSSASCFRYSNLFKPNILCRRRHISQPNLHIKVGASIMFRVTLAGSPTTVWTKRISCPIK